jgi:hypothetical protein
VNCGFTEDGKHTIKVLEVKLCGTNCSRREELWNSKYQLLLLLM